MVIKVSRKTNCPETLLYIKRPANALWFYGCNFIAKWSPTCFSHSCGLLNGGDFYAIKLHPSNPSALIGLLICFVHLIVAQNTEHFKWHDWTFSLYVAVIKIPISTTAMFQLVSMTSSNVSSLVQYFCSVAGYLCTVHCLIQHFISVVTFNTALDMFETGRFFVEVLYIVT
jgi:hypothetical protein